jgi:hypothetical protein
VGVKTNRSLALIVFVVLAATLSAFSLSLAFADDGFVADEDDSPGPLDIERFGFFQEGDGGHLILDLYEDFDPSFLDQSLNWVGFVLEDDIADGEYERAVFIKRTEDGLVARLYRDGRTGSDAGTFIGDVGVQQTDPNTLEVFIPPRQYAPFHHWYAQTAFETTGPDDRGYPECNWPTPPPRPFPPMAKCIDESMHITPTSESSPTYITIYRGEHSFSGVVRHKKNICEDERRVVLKRANGATVGKDVTDFEGRWRVRIDQANGDFYAFAREVSIARSHAEDVFCRRVRSIMIQG